MADQRDISININAKDNASATMSKVSSTASDAFKKVSAAAAVGAAAIAGMAIASVKHLADVGEQIQNFSTASGFGAKSASALGLAATGMGLSLESVAGASKKMQINLSAMAGDTKKANEALKPLGLTFDEIKTLRPEEQFVKLGDAIAQIKDPAERTTAAVKLFGKSGADLIPLFDGGKASLEDFNRAAEAAGVSMDENAIAKAKAADDAFDNLNASVSGLTQQFAISLAPAISQAVTQFTALLQPVTQWIEKNPDLTAGIVGVTTAVLGFLAILPTIIGGIGALTTALTFLSANPIGLVITGLVAFGAAMVYLFNTNEQFRTTVTEVWGYVSAFLVSTFEIIKTTISTALTEILAWWQSDHNQIRDFFIDVWTFLSTTGVDLVVTLVQKIRDTMTPLIDFIQQHWDAIQLIFQLAWAAISLGFGVFWSTVEVSAKIAWETIKTIFKVALDLLKGDWNGAWDTIKQYFVTTLTYIGTYGTTIMNLLSSFFSTVWETIKKTFSDALGVLTTNWNAFWDSFKQTAQNAINFVSGIINGVTNAINSAIASLNSFLGMSKSAGGGGGTAKRAMGGGLGAGTVTVVGEKGPELFIPDQRGTVIPNSQTSGGGGITVVVTGNTVLSDDGAEAIGDMIINKLRLNYKF